MAPGISSTVSTRTAPPSSDSPSAYGLAERATGTVPRARASVWMRPAPPAWPARSGSAPCPAPGWLPATGREGWPGMNGPPGHPPHGGTAAPSGCPSRRRRRASCPVTREVYGLALPYGRALHPGGHGVARKLRGVGPQGEAHGIHGPEVLGAGHPCRVGEERVGLRPRPRTAIRPCRVDRASGWPASPGTGPPWRRPTAPSSLPGPPPRRRLQGGGPPGPLTALRRPRRRSRRGRGARARHAARPGSPRTRRPLLARTGSAHRRGSTRGRRSGTRGGARGGGRRPGCR
jgi:hypothetical protein